MPYPRPTLTALRAQVAQAIQAELPGSDASLRFTVLNAIANATAGLAQGHYAYIAWLAKQAVPYTAEAEFLEAWAALKNVFRLAPTQASGIASFTGVVGTVIPSGTQMTRADGVQFISTADATVAATGVAAVSVQAVADPSGLTGAFGNTATGATLSLSAPITGITGAGTVSTALVGGTDLEPDDSLRARMLIAYQTRPEGGALADYIKWTLDVPGVTRAWVTPNGYGVGTVVIYFMLDVVNVSTGGFPVGT
ncbi:MAG: baseplate J/gp47 family protein, partial [Betaproteobacteria bacterium]|nr:baseplate J/gp47 family protein [Betaproteobacteria bacterium]